MLNKTSEKILRTSVHKCNKDPTKEVVISKKDFISSRFSLALIYSACEDLYKNGYLKELSSLYQDSKAIKLTLSYKGFAYFDYKRIHKIEYFKQLFTTSICSLIISLATAILTTVLLSK